MHWQHFLCKSVYLYCVTQLIWLILSLVKYHAEQWNNCFIKRNQPAFLCNCLPLFHANYLWLLNLCERLLTGPHSFIVAVSLSFSDASILIWSRHGSLNTNSLRFLSVFLTLHSSPGNPFKPHFITRSALHTSLSSSHSHKHTFTFLLAPLFIWDIT